MGRNQFRNGAEKSRKKLLNNQAYVYIVCVFGDVFEGENTGPVSFLRFIKATYMFFMSYSKQV